MSKRNHKYKVPKHNQRVAQKNEEYYGRKEVNENLKLSKFSLSQFDRDEEYTAGNTISACNPDDIDAINEVLNTSNARFNLGNEVVQFPPSIPNYTGPFGSLLRFSMFLTAFASATGAFVKPEEGQYEEQRYSGGSDNVKSEPDYDASSKIISQEIKAKMSTPEVAVVALAPLKLKQQPEQIIPPQCPIAIFYETHTDIGPAKAITSLMPSLGKHGYKTFLDE